MSKSLKAIFLLVGLGLFVWALQSVDLKTVGGMLWNLGWGFFVILLIYSLVTIIDSQAWKYNFKPEEVQDVSLGRLWRIRQIGEAFNVLTPFGTLGGEPVKAQLLKDYNGLSFKQGLASLIICRTALLIGLILFLIPGIVLVFQSEFVTPAFKEISLTGLIAFSSAILAFFIFQITGCLARVTQWTARIPLLGPLIKKQHDHIAVLDQLMTQYYRERPRLLFQSIGLALLGWIVGIGELYATFYFLGFSVDFADVWVIESLAQLVKVGSFFIPMSIGALEGGMVLIFASMGLTPDLGLAVTFVRRIKELVWTGLGLALSGGMNVKPANKVPLESPES